MDKNEKFDRKKANNSGGRQEDLRESRRKERKKQRYFQAAVLGAVLTVGIVVITVSLILLNKEGTGTLNEAAKPPQGIETGKTQLPAPADDGTTAAADEETAGEEAAVNAENVTVDPSLGEELVLNEEGAEIVVPYIDLEGSDTPETSAAFDSAQSSNQVYEVNPTLPFDSGKSANQVYGVRMQGINEEVLSSVDLVMVGDNLLHKDVQYSTSRDDITFNYELLYTFVRDRIQAADIAIINQEAVVAGDQYGIRGYPSFNCLSACIGALRNVGFDVILAANNHILDMGTIGPINMVRYFRENYPDLELLGIHDSWETRDEIHVIECNGIRIGMVNYTDLSNNMTDYYGNEYLLDFLDYDRLARLIQETKAASDFVIVFPHWGTEYEMGTDQKQAVETQFLAEQGVDLVIGTHPHVVEPIEYVDRPDGGRMLVYYSLGNYISFQVMEPTLLGGMAKVTLEKTAHGVRIGDFDMEILATEYHYPPPPDDWRLSFNTYPFSMFTWDIAMQGNGVMGWGQPFSFEYMFQLGNQLQEMVHNVRRSEGLE